MKYTKFGELFKIYRIKNGETLYDASKFLGVTNSFVSAVELGKKKVPKKWFKIIVQHYNLTEDEADELETAIRDSKNNIKVNLSNSSSFQRNLAMAFQRSFDGISEETANEIIRLLNNRSDSDGLQNKKDI